MSSASTIPPSSPVASGSTPTVPVVTEPQRPQAGPLPLKPGEIGFRGDLHDDLSITTVQTPIVQLPARHPADRDHTPPPPNPVDPPNVALPPPPAPSIPARAVSFDTSSSYLLKLSLVSRLRRRRVLGVHLTSLLTIALYFLGLAGTITVWIVAVRLVMHIQANSNSPPSRSGGGTNDTNTSRSSSLSVAIFIHVVFGITLSFQLLLLERCVFRIRAERYVYLHPEGLFPGSGSRGEGIIGNHSVISLAPWNRPPLPTYAATLAASGYGTGDVEDNLIARAPPPAYGHTRGSTLVLSGYLPERLRAQRPTSVHSQSSRRGSGGAPSPDRDQLGLRPYITRDDEWEEVQNAERAMVLEQTLARLEEAQSRPEAPPRALSQH